MTIKYIKLNEPEYRKRLRDSERIRKLKPLIKKANDILKHVKVADPAEQEK